MPENKFEKQVQQKMEELEFLPSAAVWDEVEKRIREKKRRRFLIWFCFAGLLLAGGTACWLFYDRENNPVAVANQSSSNSTVTGTTENVKDDKNDVTSTTTIATPQKNNNGIKKEVITVPTATKESPIADSHTQGDISITKFEPSTVYKKSKTLNKPIPANDKKTELSGTVTEGHKEVNEVTDFTTDISTASIVKNKNANNKKDETVAKNDLIPISNNDPAIASINPSAVHDIKSVDTVLNQPLVKTEDSSANTIVSAEKKKDIRVIKKRKWECWANIFSGSSRTTDNVLGFFGAAKMADNLFSPTGTIGSPNSLSSGPFLPVLTPSSPGNGFYWQAGVSAKRKLKTKTSFSIGLNFMANSNVQRVGEKNNAATQSVYIGNANSTSSSYYNYGNSTTYHNHYYYLQLPLAFHWQFNKGKKFPLFWENGFSFSWLVNSNALFYTNAGNIYYNDKSRLQKTQWIYQSAVYTKLFPKAKHPLTAAVQYNYHLTSLQKAGYGDNVHLSSFGIQLGWLIKK